MWGFRNAQDFKSRPSVSVSGLLARVCGAKPSQVHSGGGTISTLPSESLSRLVAFWWGSIGSSRNSFLSLCAFVLRMVWAIDCTRRRRMAIIRRSTMERLFQRRARVEVRVRACGLASSLSLVFFLHYPTFMRRRSRSRRRAESKKQDRSLPVGCGERRACEGGRDLHRSTNLRDEVDEKSMTNADAGWESAEAKKVKQRRRRGASEGSEVEKHHSTQNHRHAAEECRDKQRTVETGR